MKNTCMARAVLAGVLAATLAVGASCTSERARPGISQAPTLTDAGNAEYYGIYDYPVQLADGRYEGEPFVEGGASRPSVQLVGDLFETGDLDGDDAEEAVVLLVESSGGSGSFLYIAALFRREGRITVSGTCIVGDRVQVRSIDIDGGRVVMDVVQQGPGDGACCPSQKARRIWGLDGGDLVEKPSELTGTLSIADLAGVEWVLKQFDWNEPVPADTPVTLVFENGRLSGSSGCNRYFAEITESSPGDITIGEAGTTRMACPDEVMLLENRYLAAISGAARYSFLTGRLALTCKVGDDLKTMLFEAVEPAAPGE